ncbi:MAG TPA: hypothetical protein VEH30_07120 [Terriglobales bacterium]|nr:hypothetical protein [Terriglobales bacterium]
MLQFPRVAVVDWILSSASLWFLFSAILLKLCLPYMAGVAVFTIGVIRIRKEVASARGVDRITLLGPLFLAVPMAIFGADHFVFAESIVPLVPSWIPGHLFWVLFVGVCLVAGALSLALRRYAILAAALFGAMLFFFVLLMWLPAIVQQPSDRFAWALAFRDLTFSAGALSLAAAKVPVRWTRSANIVLHLIRVEIGIAAIFFAVEHLLHPEFKPGVPLEELTPIWIPVRLPVSYLTGLVLLITGVALVGNKRTKLAATGLGLWLLLLVIVVYAPIMIVQPWAVVTGGSDGLNFLADTVMFSGSVLCLAGSYREKVTAYATASTMEVR